MDSWVAAPEKNQLPIGMLITEVTFLPDGSAELFGFWYYKEKALPETREERRLLTLDLAIGRCCKLRLIGSARQIEDILLSADWNPSLKDIWIPGTKELVEQCRKHPAIPIELDRLDKPKGIAIPMNFVVRAKEDLYSVLRKLHSGKNEITVEIATDWNLSEEINSFLQKHSHCNPLPRLLAPAPSPVSCPSSPLDQVNLTFFATR